jgi:ribosomal peptide maturation radical SAM protein 1
VSDVLLVSMPFGPLFSPSLALSLLKGALASHGISARVRYFSLEFAELIGQDFYGQVGTEGRPPLVMLAGEWIFSGAVFPPNAGAAEAYVAEVLQRPSPPTARGSAARVTDAQVRRILRARSLVDAFLQECLDEIAAIRPRIVGFTSIFQQHLASLALAKRIKAELPDTTIVMGGANCEGTMGAETVRQFPFLDAVVSGEGEVALPAICERALEGRSFGDVPGVRTPERVEEELRAGRFTNAATVAHMDDLPYPDFGDFFAQFEATRYSRKWEASLFFETSRGCWWGERSQCTFCGLNGTSMAFRSKSAGRAMAELEQMAREHPGCDIQVVDNILDMAYFKDFLPMLADKRLGVDLFYETKSNLKKEQIRLLRRAGITRIQPGVESLSDSVLKLMRKGVSGLQNIQLLKWCKELGVEPHWNVIWGFPGEDPAEYARLAELVPHLTHLPAPVGFSDVRLDRFSPNFFDAENLGFTDIRPLPAYRHAYPGLDAQALDNLAYFFGFAYREPRDVEAYAAPLSKALRAWTKATRRGDGDLFSVDLGAQLLVWDLRAGARRPLVALAGEDRALYLACDAASDARTLARERQSRGTGAPSAVEIAARLQALADAGLMAAAGPRFLALAVPLGEYQPARKVVERFWRVARSLGEPLSAWRRRPATLTAADFCIDADGGLRVAGSVWIGQLEIGGTDEQQSRNEACHGQEEDAERVRRRSPGGIDGEEKGRKEEDGKEARQEEDREEAEEVRLGDG